MFPIKKVWESAGEMVVGVAAVDPVRMTEDDNRPADILWTVPVNHGSPSDRYNNTGVVEALNKGSWLFRAGETATDVFAVLDGAVVLRKSNISGNSLAVDLVTKGGTLGYRAYVGNGIHGLSAQCSVATVVYRIPVEKLVTATDRSLEKAFLCQLAVELSATQDRMLHVATLKVRERLLILLARIARDFTTMNDHDTVVISPPISRVDMAALAGMTPESLSRCIRAIEAEGLAHFSRHHVVIPSIAHLRAELAKIGVEEAGGEGGAKPQLSLAG